MKFIKGKGKNKIHISLQVKPKSKKLHEQNFFQFLCTVNSGKRVLEEKNSLKNYPFNNLTGKDNEIVTQINDISF